MTVVTAIVLTSSLLLGLRYWGVLLAVATNTYQFSSVYSGSFAVSVALNLLPILYLLPNMFLRRRHYHVTAVDIFLLIWLGGILVNVLRSYSLGGPLEYIARTAFFCGCYYILGRLLVAGSDRGYHYLREFTPAVILITLFFAVLAQDISGQEVFRDAQFDSVDEDASEHAGRLAVGEGNPVGYSAALNTATSVAAALACVAVFSRGVLSRWAAILTGLSVALLSVASLAAGTRGLIVAVIAVFLVSSLMAAAWRRSSSDRLTIFLVGLATVVPLYFALPPVLMWLGDIAHEYLGTGEENPLRVLASILADTDNAILDPSARARLEFWYIGRKLIEDSPFFGTATDYLQLSHFEAHNFFLEQWVAAGLFGFIASFMLVGSVARSALQLVNTNDRRVFLVGISHTAIFVGFLVQAQFSFSLYHAKMMFLAAGIVIELGRSLRRKVLQKSVTIPVVHVGIEGSTKAALRD